MPSVPLLAPREVIRAFERLGWTVARQRGSHVIMTREGIPPVYQFPTIPKSRGARLAA